MKKLLFIALLLLLPVLSEAQETYSLPANAAQVADLTAIVDLFNRDVCRRLVLSEGCTQAQACTAASAVGGSSCTAAQARAANARIFPNTQPGREEFVTFQIALPPFQSMRAVMSGKGRERYCSVWWPAQNQTTKDAECSKVNLPNGCELCP